MMKNKLFVVALIAVLMSVGLFMACRPGCPGNGTCDVSSGEGGVCTNIDVNKTTGKLEGCASVAEGYYGGSGKCDC
jgi:hypothetical protein